MSVITRVYDLLKATPADFCADHDAIVAKLMPLLEDGQILGDDDREALRLELKNKLEDLPTTIAALETAPASEGQTELVQFVDTLMSLAAYTLDPDLGQNAAERQKAEDIRNQAIKQLHPLFKQFENIYANKYSDKALEELEKSGKSMSDEERDAGRETLEQLNELCRVKLEDLNDGYHEDNIRFMQKLLLNLREHPILMNSMVGELHKYRRANMNNFQRYLENFGKASFKTIQNQSVHADYLQDWQRLGYMMGTFVHMTTEMLAHSAAGLKTPFMEDDNEQAMTNDVITVNGMPRQRVR